MGILCAEFNLGKVNVSHGVNLRSVDAEVLRFRPDASELSISGRLSFQALETCVDLGGCSMQVQIPLPYHF